MPKLVVPLTDVRIRNAKPKDKPYKLADGGPPTSQPSAISFTPVPDGFLLSFHP